MTSATPLSTKMVYKCKNCGMDVRWIDFGHLGIGYHHLSNLYMECGERHKSVTKAEPLLEEDIIDEVLKKYS
jgi:hypothetical protein